MATKSETEQRAFVSAMRRSGFEIVPMRNPSTPPRWRRREHKNLQITVSPKAGSRRPLASLADPVEVLFSAMQVFIEDDDLITLRFPSVRAMLATLPRYVRRPMDDDDE